MSLAIGLWLYGAPCSLGLAATSISLARHELEFDVMMHRRSLIGAAFAAGVIVALGGCETTTTNRPAVPSRWDGYRDLQIGPERWRVSFRGGALTSREMVENYLLYRAADLTVQSGYDWFRALTPRAGGQAMPPVNISATAGGGSLPKWRPYWRFRRMWWGPVWQTWDPAGPDRFADIQKVTAYEAWMDIVAGKGEKPLGPDAFDARTVLSSYGPSVARPK